MIDDVRYSELLFLRALSKGVPEYFHANYHAQDETYGLSPYLLGEMVAALIEDLFVRFDDQHQPLIARLRGEIPHDHEVPDGISLSQWRDPRRAIFEILTYGIRGIRLRITYRGLRRIEELREELRRDRILEPFGVLLSIQYFRKDLKDALDRGADVPVSVFYADMDDFGVINKQFGQEAGDVVLKSFLEIVRDTLGIFGTGYRGLGDETTGLIIGQNHQRTVELVEEIRKKMESHRVSHKEKKLPAVTATIGLASNPPDVRTMDLITLADQRKLQAKANGKNQVVSK